LELGDWNLVENLGTATSHRGEKGDGTPGALADGGLADYQSGSGCAVVVFTVPVAGQGAGVQSVDLNGGAIFATEAASTLRMADLAG
jgi:hypothetical protein